jgi:hypothetical protein
MMHRFSWVLVVLSGMLACRPGPAGGSVVTVRLFGAIHRTVRIETLPIAGEAVRVLDSARVGSNDATMTFRIAEPEELVCRLQVPGSDFSVPFILHPGSIHIEGHFILPSEMATVRSPVNTPHDSFLDRRAEAWQRAAERMELAGTEADTSVRAQQLYERDSILAAREREAFRYADTVFHPGAFLHAYGFLDFGRDRAGMKAFIRRAGRRFPGHAGVARLQSRLLAYLGTFEEEFQVGQAPPTLSLPDAMGRRVAVPDTGRAVLVAFWSTWSNPAIDFLDEERRLQPWLDAGRLRIVNIALEGEKDTWNFFTATRRVPGLHLIDTGGWEGPVIRRWRIDSIPFNWLVAPDGKIVRKAIPKDSLYASIKAVLGETSR